MKKNKRKIYAHKYYLKNKNTIIKQYYIENKDKIHKRRHLHYIKNKNKIRKYRHKHYIKNKNKIKQYMLTHKDIYRSLRLKYRYGIVLIQKQKMIKDQNYKCKCCGQDLRLIKQRHIHVDHNHITNKVRGILCYPCNSALGLMKENPQLIQKLKNYAIYCRDYK
jgi:hypothetical protein